MIPFECNFQLSYSWEYGSSFNPHISVSHLKNIKKLAGEYNHVPNNFPHSLSIMIDVYQYHAVMKWISTPLDSRGAETGTSLSLTNKQLFNNRKNKNLLLWET